MADNSPIVASGQIELYPNMEKFSAKLADTLNGIVKSLGDGFELGDALTKDMQKSLSSLTAPDIEVNGTRAEAVVGHLQTGMSSLGEIGTKAIGTVSSAVTNTLGKAISSSAKLLGDSVASVGKIGLGAAGAGIGALATQAVGGGFSRAMSFNEAEAQLQALGYEEDKLEAVMDSAVKGVEGTSFMTADAAKASTAFLTSGIKPGEELEKVLMNISNTAAQSGSSFGEIATIMQKVATTGKLTGGEIAQLQERGIPVTKVLSEAFGKTAEEILEMGAAGEISSEMLQNALADSDLIASASDMAKLDFGQALTGVRAYLGMLTQPFWAAGIKEAIPALNAFKDILDKIISSKAFERFRDPIVEKITAAFQDLTKKIENVNVGKLITRISTGFEKIKSLVIPLSGLVLGFAGSLLSSVPIIGRVFAGLTGPVGLFIGIIAGAIYHSTRLQEAFSGLFEKVQEVFGAMFSSANTDGKGFSSIFKLIGDNLAIGIDAITRGLHAVAPAIIGFFHDITGGGGGAFTGATSFFTGIGSLISNVISAIISVLSDPGFLTAVHSLIDAVSLLVGGLSGSIGAFLGGDGAGVSLITSGITFVITAIASLIRAIGIFASAAFVFLQSSQMQAVINFLGTIIQWVLGNETAIKVIGVVLAAFFAGLILTSLVAKALAVVQMMVGAVMWVRRLGTLLVGGKAVTAAATAATTGIRTLATGFMGAMSAVWAALPVIMKGILAISAIVLAVIAVIVVIGLLFSIPAVQTALVNFMTALEMLLDLLKNFVGFLLGVIGFIIVGILDTILSWVGPIITALTPFVQVLAFFIVEVVREIAFLAIGILNILFWALSEIGGVISYLIYGILYIVYSLVGGIVAALQIIGDVILGVVYGVVNIIYAITFGLISLMVGLAKYGIDAGAGAVALAAGLVALAAAMTGGALVSGVGNLGESVLSGIGGLFGGKQNAESGGFVQDIISLGEALQGTDQILKDLPARWGTLSEQAMSTGAAITRNLSTGIKSGRGPLQTTVENLMQGALNAAQTKANAQPIVMRVEVDDSALARQRANYSSSGRGTGFARSEDNGKIREGTPEIHMHTPDTMASARQLARIL